MIRKRQYKKSPPKYFMLLTLERKHQKVGIRGKDDSFKGKGEISRTCALTTKTTNRINSTASAG